MGKFNPRQFENQLKQGLNKWKRDVDREVRKIERDYNSAVNKYNQEVNREVRKYNNQVTQINNQVRNNRQRLISAFNTFNNSLRNPSATIAYSAEYTQSVSLVHRSYEHLESLYDRQTSNEKKLILGLSENEDANNLLLYNSLSGNDEDDGQLETNLQRNLIEELLEEISPDFRLRWDGAIFALQPSNPDAARQFCTSARAVCKGILDIFAPDDEVKRFPGCEYTEERNPKPTRRSKINYLLDQKSINGEQLITFIEDDINSMLQLFHELNSGTHGSAGRFGIPQLLKLKTRSEDYIKFMASIGSKSIVI